jgi:hypothetical protein
LEGGWAGPVNVITQPIKGKDRVLAEAIHVTQLKDNLLSISA